MTSDLLTPKYEKKIDYNLNYTQLQTNLKMQCNNDEFMAQKEHFCHCFAYHYPDPSESNMQSFNFCQTSGGTEAYLFLSITGGFNQFDPNK